MTLRHFRMEVVVNLRVQCGSPLIHLGLTGLLLRTLSTGKKRDVEALWRDFFSNTSEWCDHRPEKINPRFPDFKHKQTGEALWLVYARKHPWVQAKLAAIPPGTLKSNVFAWAQKLKRYVKAGQYSKTIKVFNQMKHEGLCPDTRTFLPVLNACAGLGDLEEGKNIHTQIIQRGYESDRYVANCLVDMYAKCGSIEDAWSVFSTMQEHDVVSWSAMIAGYVKFGEGRKAMELFQKMQEEGVKPNAVTFIGMLNACASVAALQEGRCVHEQIIQRGYQSDGYVANCLVNMYAKCGSIGDAWIVFNKMLEHDVVSWSAIIGGFVKFGQGLKAIRLFRQMQQEGVDPNAVTFVGVLNACASEAALEEGRGIHEEIIRRGYESDAYVANCLVDMYAKCGSIGDAWSVFIKMRGRNVVSWSAMIGGYVKSAQGLKAMELFREMQQEGVEPNTITFGGVLNACASVAALEEGRRVHEQIVKRGCESDAYVATCLVDMYAKCGSIEDAWSVFNKIRKRSVVFWNAMIGGYAMHGYCKKAIELYERMGKERVEINGVTFTCLLSACSHGGLVKEGLRYFKSMMSCYNIHPTKKHCASMVDLLARAGRLEEAEEMMKRMPVEENASAWTSLLGACRIQGNIDIAERAAKWCCDLDPENSSGHVLLSNTYAAAVKEERVERTGWRKLGRIWIDVNNVVHSFVINGKVHPRILEIHAELERLSVQMKEAGYTPYMRFMLHGKEGLDWCPHSEELAIGYGLISTPPGTPLRIKKICSFI